MVARDDADLDADAPALPRSVGRYAVVRLLGEGAMGRVLLAHDPILDREVAIKHLRGDLTLARDARAALLVRMRHEARAAARVTHPNLVVLHDMGEDEGVGLFLVFEFIDGPTLKDRLREGPLAPFDVGLLAREVGSALTRAHEAGVLHRDVKPENVMLAASGAKVADFGIARVPDSTLTHQGGLLGTPAYSAPETFHAGGGFSAASDQFSLAATLYEAASGLRAYPGDDAVGVAALIRDAAPPALAERAGLPAAVDAVIRRAMAQDPKDRYPSCEAFGDAFDRAVTGALAPSARGGELKLPPPERKLVQVAVGALVVVVTAGLLVRAAVKSLDRVDPDPLAPPSAEPAPAATRAAAAAPVEAPAPRRRHRARAHPSATATATAPAASATATAAPSASATATAKASASAAPAAPPATARVVRPD